MSPACSVGKGPVIQSECAPCQAHKAAEGGARWKCVYRCGELMVGGGGLVERAEIPEKVAAPEEASAAEKPKTVLLGPGSSLVTRHKLECPPFS